MYNLFSKIKFETVFWFCFLINTEVNFPFKDVTIKRKCGLIQN
jgi:hypothetical protein